MAGTILLGIGLLVSLTLSNKSITEGKVRFFSKGAEHN
jgi:hypothetical protein